MDKRLFEIECWAGNKLGQDINSIVPASSDASFRRYFRISVDDGTYIIMDAPPDKEDTASFVYASAALEGLGLNVPHVFSRSEKQGLMLLDDLGSRLYLDELNDETAGQLYRDAISALVRLQQGPRLMPGTSFPPYDENLLVTEMGLFNEWYVERHLEYRLDRGQSEALRESVALVSASALRQPQTWVHRDYHSRNLMVVPGQNPGIIDFQDMVIGPVTYDLVSLLKDCYISWPRGRVEQWVDDYLARSSTPAESPVYDRSLFLEWFDLMGVQRHLKVLGIFARLNYRDGKQQYLDDLPRVLEYLLETSAVYPSLAPLNKLLLELHPRVEPA